MSDKEIFFRRMKRLREESNNMDEVEQLSAVGWAAGLDDQEVHEEYIKNAGLESLHLLLAGYPIDQKDSWPYHAKAISEGKYPLNNLPEGVRELARTLYYEK